MVSNAGKVLVTGAFGCLGAWIVRTLLDRGATPVAVEVGDSRHRLKLLLSEDELSKLSVIRGSIVDPEIMDGALREHRPTAVIHLAALQVPFCAADPLAGAQVNVLGTVNVFDAVKRQPGDVRLVYASSAAVYGRSDQVGESEVGELADPHPNTHYGVYKLANEGTARVYWQQHAVPSIGIRPYTVFGLGRDQGLTSSPTKAMLAAALGRPYEIGYSSRSQLHWAPDVAAAFVSAALDTQPEGAYVFNMGGPAVEMAEVVAHIEAAAPEIAGRISIADNVLPFPTAFGSTLRTALPVAPPTPLVVAIAQTVDAFKALAKSGKISAEGML